MKRNLEKWKKIKCGGCARYVRMPSCGREGGEPKKIGKKLKKNLRGCGKGRKGRAHIHVEKL